MSKPKVLDRDRVRNLLIDKIWYNRCYLHLKDEEIQGKAAREIEAKFREADRNLIIEDPEEYYFTLGALAALRWIEYDYDGSDPLDMGSCSGSGMLDT